MNVEKSSVKDSKTARLIMGFISEHYLFIILIALIIAGSVLSPKFLTTRNIMNVLLQNSMNAIVAMGMLFVIITGGIDLSVGSIYAFAGCLVAGFLQGGMNTITAVLIVLLLMAVMGAISGTLVGVGKVAPFIATLAMMTIIRGAAYIYQIGSDRRIDGTPLTNFIGSSFLMVPTPVFIMAVVVAITWIILGKTTIGRSIYAVGGNIEASRLSGIRIPLTLIVVYAFSAVTAGASGIIMTGRLSLGTAIVGEGAEMDAIASVVVGGASLSGGKGSVINTLIGAFIIGLLVNIMNLMHVPAYPQMITKGIIILVAVLWKKKN